MAPCPYPPPLHTLTHVCTYTHTQTYARACVHTHTRAQTHKHAQTHTYGNTHTHTRQPLHLAVFAETTQFAGPEWLLFFLCCSAVVLKKPEGEGSVFDLARRLRCGHPGKGKVTLTAGLWPPCQGDPGGVGGEASTRICI